MKTKRWVRITRFKTSDQGTFSDLATDTLFQCVVGEPPWRNNERGFSCIPAGEYEAALADTPKHGKVYEVKVAGRTAILFHAGNFVGDSRQKFKADSEGCLLPGRSVGSLAGQEAVTSSKDALAGLMADLDGEPFKLIVKWAPGVGPEEKS